MKRTPGHQQEVQRKKTDEKLRCVCDICGEADGFQGMNMQQCHECGVAVHELCYSLVSEKREGEKYDQWKCCACAAVGTCMTVSKPNEKHRSIKISSRPKKCELCSIDHGDHAMHPLYDNWGKDGSPILLLDEESGEEVVAWVHTLCAMFICNKYSFVYGCDKEGNYEDPPEEEDDSSFESHSREENEFNYYERGSLALSSSTHHFVLQNVNDTDEWARALRVHQKNKLKCYICGQDSETNPNMITTQCSSNCSQPFHVGCAKWGKKSKRGQIVFNPGREVEDDKKGVIQPVSKGFCTFHSRKRVINGKSSTKRGAEEMKMCDCLSKLKYKARRREIDGNFRKMVIDYEDAVDDAKRLGTSAELSICRRKNYWKQSRAFTATEFKKKWAQLEEEMIRKKKYVFIPGE